MLHSTWDCYYFVIYPWIKLSPKSQSQKLLALVVSNCSGGQEPEKGFLGTSRVQAFSWDCRQTMGSGGKVWPRIHFKLTTAVMRFLGSFVWLFYLFVKAGSQGHHQPNSCKMMNFFEHIHRWDLEKLHQHGIEFHQASLQTQSRLDWGCNQNKAQGRNIREEHYLPKIFSLDNHSKNTLA